MEKEEKISKLFYALESILQRTHLNENNPPLNPTAWHEFLDRLNNCFNDLEQERYLLERSMEISSREMLELNERLESSQKIAHIGYWLYNPNSKRTLWSSETYRIVGLDPALPIPSIDKLMDLVHEEERENLYFLINQAITKGEPFEKEFRIVNVKDQEVHWTYLKGHVQQSIKTNSNNYLLSGIVMDITARKKSEEAIAKLNQQLLTISRQAGMSEVATSILHNLGNVLNTMNISISLIKELLENSEIQNLKKISDLINANVTQGNFLLSDPKGKLIPSYLTMLAKSLLDEYEEIQKELQKLSNSSDHMKSIIVMQKDISGVAGIQEKILLPEICDQALQIGCPEVAKYDIHIVKNYEYAGFLLTDKAKLLQILVNLIRNAKEALIPNYDKYPKKIIFSIRKINSHIEILVEDNGIGIDPQYLTKIFTMGYTTKPKGHGFGLHSSALAANELGGKLTAYSEGKGKGTLFTLKLPLSKKKRGESYGEIQ